MCLTRYTGLLCGGLLPALRHALTTGLTTRDVDIIPRAATLYVQARLLMVFCLWFMTQFIL